MSFASKRPFESNASEPNGRGKWRKIAHSASHHTSLKIPAGAVVFRVLCPALKTGSLLGKGGGIISKIRQETGAKVKLEDIVPGCEERVVVIIGLEKDAVMVADVSNEHAKEGDEDADFAEHTKEGAVDAKECDEDADVAEHTKEGAVHAKEGDEDADVADADRDDERDKVRNENNEEKEESSVLESSKSVKATSSAQKALLLVFESIIEGEAEEGEGEDEDEDEESKESNVSVRLLIVSNQVGCLLGKGGSVVKQMISDSGAQIRVLPKDKIPACASPHDEIVQITGGIESARKALELVSQLLIENPPRDPFPAAKPPSRPNAPISRPERPQFLPPQGPPFSNRHYNGADIPPFPKFHGSVGLGQMQGFPELIVFRMLCSNDKVGSVIGRGGNIVKSLKLETGCHIKIIHTTPKTDDRLILISSPVFPGDRGCPAQDGVLLVQQRIAMAVPEGSDNVLSRLLVYSYQTGCLLGKGGAIISEMRKLSGAHIRVLSKDQIPKGASENDEVIQVSGQLRVVQDALQRITDRLKDHFLRAKVPPMNYSGHPAFLDQILPFGAYMGRRELSPPRMFSNFPPFQKDIAGRSHEERPGFPHAIHGPGIPPHGLDRVPPGPWASQVMREGSGSMPMPDYPGGGPPRRIGGFAAGNNPPFITSTTVDVVVPRAIIPSIYGEEGGCLRRIREISEAMITINEPRPEATESVIIISGTPEQTHAAQSLIQAFVLSENAPT